MALGVDHDEQPLFDPAYQLIAVFAVTVSSVGVYDAIGVKKRVCRISKIESALTEAGVILDVVPFKTHALSVVQWTMIGKTVRVRSNTNVRQGRANRHHRHKHRSGAD